MKTPNEKIIAKPWHAGFQGFRQVTSWYRCKDRLYAAMRRMMRAANNHREVGKFSIHTKVFVEKRSAA